MDSEVERARTQDELPQSAAGKTIMTTEPKFVQTLLSNSTWMKA